MSELPWFVLDIPKPPSVNQFIARLGNKTPCVQQWRHRADQHLLARGRYPRIKGAFDLKVEFPAGDRGKYDLDNRLKALLDWMQSRELIENDRLARQISVAWGEAPEGCRVRLCPAMDHVGAEFGLPPTG